MNWLSDYIRESFDIKEYVDRMTATGSKVEGYEFLGEEIQNVVVGRVISMERHPDSDHLWICMVDVGKENPIQIVTGAQNVHQGDYVPAALAGSLLPGAIKIKSGKLRGVVSDGMLCSLGELGLTLHDFPYAEEDGIFILHEDDMKVGMDIRDLLMLKDTVVDFEITPNRPDCLSVLGLVKETAASFDVPATILTPVVKTARDGDSIDRYLSVDIKEPTLCPRYTARIVKNVRIAPSPKWMRAYLRACGIRPINNIVDITNFINLEYGQPMHAFDYAYLSGKQITVRRAEAGESITTLDGIQRTLTDRMLVIADAEKAVAVAGVMGGQNSEITDTTTTVVFESANFNGASVRTTSRALGLRTESSAKYEKGLDRENTLSAIERACELVELIGAGDVVGGWIDVYPAPKQQIQIPFQPDRINRFLGTDIPEEFMRRTLQKLEIRFDGEMLLPPSYREDLQCFEDIAEEVIRIYGYDKIPTTKIRGEVCLGKKTARQKYLDRVQQLLLAQGYSEIQTFSFVSPKGFDAIGLKQDDPLRHSIVISNPLGEDTSMMRTTALPSMLEVLSTNRRHRNKSACLFEMAKIYLPSGKDPVTGKDGLADERLQTIFAFYNAGDFYTMKGVAEQLLSLSQIAEPHLTAVQDLPYFHPGRCARYTAQDGAVLMTFGQVHPAVADRYGLDLDIYACICETETLFALSSDQKRYTPLPKYPSVERDLAFVCRNDIQAGTLRDAIRRYAGTLLEQVEVFDVYRDAKLGKDNKSMAYNLVLRAKDRTLSDAECDKVVNKILKGLETDFGVTLRQ